jgi:hypothetical protein
MWWRMPEISGQLELSGCDYHPGIETAQVIMLLRRDSHVK